MSELYHELTIFQQTSYKEKAYIRHFRNYYLMSITGFLRLQVVLFSVLYILFEMWYIGFVLLFIIFGCIMLKEEKIIKLKITKRMIRLIITILIIICGFLCLESRLLYGLVYIAPILILLSNFGNKPFEMIINRYYVNKARKKLESMELIKIGITGSYGKTSCKNFLYNILKNNYIIHKTPKSFNTLMGVTKDIIQNLDIFNEIYVVELGATKPKDIEKLNKLLNVNIGIISSIGTQHLDSFKNIENILNTKLEILKSKNIKTIVINADNSYLDEHNYPEDIKVIRVGIENQNVDYCASEIAETFNKITFKIKNNIVELNLLGVHNVMNVMLTYAVCKELGMNDFEIIEEIKQLRPIEHRLSLIKYPNYQVIDDSFNSNFEGFINALHSLNLSNTYKILITPGIVDQKEKLQEYYKKISDEMINIVDYAYLIDNENIYILEEFLKEKNYHHYRVVSSFKDAFQSASSQSKFVTILIENDLTDYYLSRG